MVYKLCERFHKLPQEIYTMPYADYIDLLICMDMDEKLQTRQRRMAKARRR